MGYNGYGAASTNHLHAQCLFYENVDGYAAPLPIERIAGVEEVQQKDSLKLQRLSEYPVNGLQIDSNSAEEFMNAVIVAVCCLLKSNEYGHNLIFTRGTDHVRAYVVPRVFQKPSTDGRGIGFLELAGESIVVEEDALTKTTAHTIWDELEAVKMPDEKFLEWSTEVSSRIAGG